MIRVFYIIMVTKGIAWYTVFLIIAIGFFTIVTILLLGKYLGFSGEKATEFSCKIKLQTYCQKLLSGENPDWNEIEPTSGCDSFGIEKPTEGECRDLLQ